MFWSSSWPNGPCQRSLWNHFVTKRVPRDRKWWQPLRLLWASLIICYRLCWPNSQFWLLQMVGARMSFLTSTLRSLPLCVNVFGTLKSYTFHQKKRATAINFRLKALTARRQSSENHRVSFRWMSLWCWFVYCTFSLPWIYCMHFRSGSTVMGPVKRRQSEEREISICSESLEVWAEPCCW